MCCTVWPKPRAFLCGDTISPWNNKLEPSTKNPDEQIGIPCKRALLICQVSTFTCTLSSGSIKVTSSRLPSRLFKGKQTHHVHLNVNVRTLLVQGPSNDRPFLYDKGNRPDEDSHGTHQAFIFSYMQHFLRGRPFWGSMKQFARGVFLSARSRLLPQDQQLAPLILHRRRRQLRQLSALLLVRHEPRNGLVSGGGLWGEVGVWGKAGKKAWEFEKVGCWGLRERGGIGGVGKLSVCKALAHPSHQHAGFISDREVNIGKT